MSWLERFARGGAIAGVGNQNQEWLEWTGYAFHVRRRLTKQEQDQIGDAIDCRDTEEGRQRFEAIKHELPKQAVELAKMEIVRG